MKSVPPYDSVGTARSRRFVGISALLLGAFLVGFGLNFVTSGVVVTVDWNSTRQSMDGFGASATGYTGTFTSSQIDKFFDSAVGLGLSLLRIRVIPDTVDADCGCVSNSSPYACVLGSKSQILSGDLQVAQLAAAREVELFAAPWSPPAAMKSSGSYCTGGSMKGNKANYTAYAAALASFPPMLNAHGLSIYAMSIQNEPDVENSTYDTCTWTAEQIHDFIPYLSNAFGSAGFASIKIAIPEESSWTFHRMGAAMDDPSVASKVGLILAHAYNSESPSGISPPNGLHVWQTEAGNFNRYDGSIEDGLVWARQIHNYMSIGANAWMYWQLDCGPKYFNKENNMCLTDQEGNFAKRAYVLGQYAKFIRPGWQRIDVKNLGLLLVSAYKGPDKKFAIVAVNMARRPARNQSFVLNGITCQRSRVTPWITSATASLAAQFTVPLESNGSAFKYTIPAKSVVTFQGQCD